MRLRAVVVAVVAAAACVPAASAAPLPPTLSGEHFAPTFIESVGLCDSVPNPTILYHVTGVATGPYPGTFEETGRIVITPAGTTTVAPLVDWTAHFTISSPVGDVEGDKQFSADAASSGIGQCEVFTPPSIRIKTAKGDDLAYTATIDIGAGRGHEFVDCGTSDLFFSDVTLPPAFQAFGEDYLSSLAEPERAHPGHGDPVAC